MAAGLAAGLALLVAGCAGAGGGWRADATPESVLHAGLAEIETSYVRPVEMERLGLAALGGLDRIAPGLDAARRGDRLTLSRAGTRLAEIDSPRGDSPRAWARAATELIARARLHAPALARASHPDLTRALLAAVTDRLDRHSRYVDPSAARASRARRDGYAGVGLAFGTDAEGRFVIRRVYPGTPAAAASLARGDVITHIDGRPSTRHSLESASAAIRGPAGSAVRLGIARGGDREPRGSFGTVTLTRAEIVPDMVRARRMGHVGVLTVTQFNSQTARDLGRAIDSLASEAPGPEPGPEPTPTPQEARGETEEAGGTGTAPRGWVLDLRGNPGGILEQAVAVADLFLETGRILDTAGRHRAAEQHYRARRGDELAGAPLVVMIDGDSASAAEIVAAALQGNGRAPVVGATSHGKGSVQTVTRLPDGGELLLTWAWFQGPDGIRLHRLGVVPELCLSRPGGVEAALDRLRAAGPDRRAGLDATRRAAARAVAARTAKIPELAALDEACPRAPLTGEAALDAARRIAADSALYRRLTAATLAARPGDPAP